MITQKVITVRSVAPFSGDSSDVAALGIWSFYSLHFNCWDFVGFLSATV
jgi:hypothetical protein